MGSTLSTESSEEEKGDPEAMGMEGSGTREGQRASGCCSLSD